MQYPTACASTTNLIPSSSNLLYHSNRLYEWHYHKLLSQKPETLPASWALHPISHCGLWPPFTEYFSHFFITEFRPPASLLHQIFTAIVSCLLPLFPIFSFSFSFSSSIFPFFFFFIFLLEFFKIEKNPGEENNSYSNHSELITVDILFT